MKTNRTKGKPTPPAAPAPAPRAAPKKEKLSATKWAKFWHVSRVTIYEWVAKTLEGRMPAADNVPAMLRWEKENPSKQAKFAARCAQLRAEAGEEPEKPKEDRTWIAFRESFGAGGAADHKAQLKSLEMFRDGYALKLDEALRTSDNGAVKRWNELLIETTNAIRQNQLAAEKLGINHGDIISFAEMDRIIWALGFWLLRSTDLHLDALALKLAALSPGFDPKAVRAVLEPELLSNRFLVPFAKASKASGVSLPARAIEKLKTVCGDFLDRGEEAFHEAQRQP